MSTIFGCQSNAVVTLVPRACLPAGDDVDVDAGARLAADDGEYDGQDEDEASEDYGSDGSG